MLLKVLLSTFVLSTLANVIYQDSLGNVIKYDAKKNQLNVYEHPAVKSDAAAKQLPVKKEKDAVQIDHNIPARKKDTSAVKSDAGAKQTDDARNSLKVVLDSKKSDFPQPTGPSDEKSSELEKLDYIIGDTATKDRSRYKLDIRYKKSDSLRKYKEPFSVNNYRPRYRNDDRYYRQMYDDADRYYGPRYRDALPPNYNEVDPFQYLRGVSRRYRTLPSGDDRQYRIPPPSEYILTVKDQTVMMKDTKDYKKDPSSAPKRDPTRTKKDPKDNKKDSTTAPKKDSVHEKKSIYENLFSDMEEDIPEEKDVPKKDVAEKKDKPQ